jgi:hypothetical protein
MSTMKGSQVKNISRFIAAVAALLTMAGFAAVPQISAQTPEPVDSIYAVFTELSGFESGVVRTFSTDSTDMSAVASPDATAMASPVAGGEVSRVTTAILQFDSEANAINALAKIQNEIQGENAAAAFVLADLGDKKAAFTLEDESGTTTGSTIVVQAGDQVVVVIAEGVDTDSEALMTDLARSIVETEAGTGEPQFAPDGTSTGGLWDRLPAADDASLADLTVVEDTDLQPAQG